MQKLIITLLLVISTILSAQQSDSTSHKKMQFGMMLGMGFQKNDFGSRYILEARYLLSNHVKIKMSVGLSSLFSKEGYFIKSFYTDRTFFEERYVTNLTAIVKHEYTVYPISIGIEYILNNNLFSPFFSLETGINSYRTKMVVGNYYPGYGGIYDSLSAMPADYKYQIPLLKGGESFRIAFGCGFNYSIINKFGMELRYLYEINTKIVNNHLVLIGFNLN